MQRTRAVTLVLLAVASAVGHCQWLRAPTLHTWSRNQWSVAAVLAAMAIAGLASLRIRRASLATAAVALGVIAGGTWAHYYGNHSPLIDSFKNYLSASWFDAAAQIAAAATAAHYATHVVGQHRRPDHPRHGS